MLEKKEEWSIHDGCMEKTILPFYVRWHVWYNTGDYRKERSCLSNYSLNLSILTLRTILQAAADIFIIWLIFYYVLRIVRNNSRTIQIFKGILLIITVDICANFLGLKTLKYFTDIFLNWGFLAIIIIFQPELRSILEKIGKNSFLASIHTLTGNEKENLVDQIVSATMLLSKDQTGALISIEKTNSLDDFVETGIQINSVVTAELLTSIFVTSTPLHDGAVIIQGDRIACASAYFPPTNQDVPSRYGARHRAAIGISEITDCITIVVSEETGNISIAQNGKMFSVDRKTLHDFLMHEICGDNIEIRSRISTSDSSALKKKSVLDKLALRRQNTVKEEKQETEEAVSDSHKLQVESVRPAITPESKTEAEREDEIHKAADAEAIAAEIKLPHKKKRPKPSYPDQSSRPKRMTPEEVQAARKAAAASLSHDTKEQVPKAILNDEHEKFDTTKLDISKIVGFNDELDRQFKMVDDLTDRSSSKKGGDDR